MCNSQTLVGSNRSGGKVVSDGVRSGASVIGSLTTVGVR